MGIHDAAHTPHGDGNWARRSALGWRSPGDAAHTPHGDGNAIVSVNTNHQHSDAAHTPHGDGSGHEGRGKYQSGRKNTARVIFQSPVRCFLR